ncbi:hypothetical protein D3C85_1192250 [compost metagenome]
MRRLNLAEPVTLVRSPTFTNMDSAVMISGSRPERRQATGSSGRARGLMPATASAMARMWVGVVPQQPPTRFRKPLWAHSRMCSAISPASRSYSPKALGRPALGWALTWLSLMRDSSSTYWRSSSGPSAQLRPNDSGLTWRREW